MRIWANLDSDFEVIRTAVSLIANALGAQATPDDEMSAQLSAIVNSDGLFVIESPVISIRYAL